VLGVGAVRHQRCCYCCCYYLLLLRELRRVRLCLSRYSYCYCRYYYYDNYQHHHHRRRHHHHHPYFSLVSFYCCTWHSRATPSLPLSSKGSKWT